MEEQRIQNIYNWAKQEINDLLNYFIDNVKDPSGGFYGAVDKDFNQDKNAERSLVLNARIMWTFASAYRILGDKKYLEIAKYAKDYIIKNFIDNEYGGAYWMLDSEGKPKDESKYPYGMAFIIYGGAELMRASEDKEALDIAIKMYKLLEEHTKDPQNGGYFETYSRDWQRRSDSINIKDPAMGSKALNTHLHMIESYTTLMLVDNDPTLRKTVRNLIDIMSNKILNHETYHFKPCMTDDWKPYDSLFSLGHDIEGAWLLTEAVNAFDDKTLIEQCKPLSIRIADACIPGINPETGGLYAEGNDKGLVDTQMSWWVQAEAVIGFFNAYELSGDLKYLTCTENIIEYIKTHLSDHKGNIFRGWMSRGDLPENDVSNVWRVHAMKGPYHEGRMYLELIERIGKKLNK